MQVFCHWLKGFYPEPLSVNKSEQLRAAIGALLGIFFTSAISYYFCSPTTAQWLIAPMGASAVLLFAVPSSPLAQPWSIIGGNTFSAAIGITCALLIDDLGLAAAVAIGLSVVAMFALRCLHPPSGAVALTAVLGGAGLEPLGYDFVLFPVGINSLCLLMIALLYNNITQRSYPHAVRPKPLGQHNTTDKPAMERFGFTLNDLDDVLKKHNQVIDVSRDDLQELFVQTEMHAYRRKMGEITCAEIMSRDVVSVEFGTLIEDAWALLRTHHIKALPVIDKARRVIGIVTQIDFMKEANLDAYENFDQKLKKFIRRTRDRYSDKPEVVGQIMTKKVMVAYEDMHIISLIPLMAEGVHHIPVLNAENRLVGVVTQSDFIGALYRQV